MKCDAPSMPAIVFGSVCSGIEAASAAWHPLGWRAAWLAEIDRFACAVLAHHYPSVPNLGDMTKIALSIRDGFVQTVDVLCGGTPCQAFSIAGLRNSLDDARGNLSLVFCEIADENDTRRAADGLLPAVIVWENVPGVLSTKDNAFGCFLAGLAGEDDPIEPPGGKWANAGCVYGPKRTVAWRVLDAQYFGVAQRRARVLVVASAREGFDPAEVLFEFDGVRRDTPPSREAGQGTAAGTLRSTDGGCDVDHALAGHIQPAEVIAGGQLARCLTTKTRIDAETETLIPTIGGAFVDADAVASITGTLQANGKAAGSATQQDAEAGMLVPVLSVALRGRDGGATAELGDEVAGCLRASGGGGDKAHVLAPIAFSMKDFGGDASVDLAPTLRAGNHNTSHANGGQPPAIAFDARQDCVSSVEVFGALGASSPQAQAVCHTIGSRDVAGALTSSYGKQPDSSDSALGPNLAICVTGDITHTLKADGFDASEDGTGRGQPIVAAAHEDAYSTKLHNTCSNQAGKIYREYTVSLDANSPPPALLTSMAVRRLTPRECERLQSFPDDYTLIPYGRVVKMEKLEQDWIKYLLRGGVMTLDQVCQAAADGPRYKALGNSWCVYKIRWLGRRIHAALFRAFLMQEQDAGRVA